MSSQSKQQTIAQKSLAKGRRFAVERSRPQKRVERKVGWGFKHIPSLPPTYSQKEGDKKNVFFEQEEKKLGLGERWGADIPHPPTPLPSPSKESSPIDGGVVVKQQAKRGNRIKLGMVGGRDIKLPHSLSLQGDFVSFAPQGQARGVLRISPNSRSVWRSARLPTSEKAGVTVSIHRAMWGRGACRSSALRRAPLLVNASLKQKLSWIRSSSQLIKTPTRHTFWQGRSFKYKINKLLSATGRKGVIKESVFDTVTQNKVATKLQAFTDLGSRAKEPSFVRRTPYSRLHRSFAPFDPTSLKTILELQSIKVQKSIGFQPKSPLPQARIIANIQNTLNNTIITITDRSGNTKLWCSSGSIGLKTSRRSTNYAAQSVAEAVASKCIKLGIRRVEVRIQGVGYGKPSALKGLRIGGLKISQIVDITPKPHNGCRAPKKRRV